MYSDLDKRRSTTRERVRRYRDKRKGVTTVKDDVTPNVTPDKVNPVDVAGVRSIGLGVDCRAELLHKFIGGK